MRALTETWLSPPTGEDKPGRNDIVIAPIGNVNIVPRSFDGVYVIPLVFCSRSPVAMRSVEARAAVAHISVAVIGAGAEMRCGVGAMPALEVVRARRMAALSVRIGVDLGLRRRRARRYCTNDQKKP